MCAVEAKRKCGFRQLDGKYLVGTGLQVFCDRLPIPVPDVCPTCDEGLRHTRAPRKINALKLWGEHLYCSEERSRMDPLGLLGALVPPCYVCHPSENTAYLMGVGENHYPTPKDFIDEAITLGVSKRIPAVPKDIELGKTVVFLTHKKALQLQTLPGEKEKYQTGVIYAFVVTRVEQIVKQSELGSVREKLEKRGITPVGVPDEDPDHVPKSKRTEPGVVKPPAEVAQ